MSVMERVGIRQAARRRRRPRVGFLGLGWIGYQRMTALKAAGLAEIAAVADVDPSRAGQAAADCPGAVRGAGLEDLLALDLDGLVIATPSALHAPQAIAALEAGLHVFCQKPLACTEEETARAVAAARNSDRLLDVDLSYRHTAALQAARRLTAGGELGHVYAGDFVFHNAYGPDKPWFTQRSLSGGGCVIDLGTHLIDMAMSLTGADTAEVTRSRLLRRGRPLSYGSTEVEDFAEIDLGLGDGIAVRIACSWFLPAGRECIFGCTLYGSDGAVSISNVDGSFYDFRADHHRGTSSTALALPPDDWGPRAIRQWAQRISAGAGFDPEVERLTGLARVIDDAYGRTP